MKKLIAEQENKKDRKTFAIITFLVTLVAVLFIARVGVANRLVESSAKLRELDQKISSLKNENDQLAEDNRVNNSLSYLENVTKSLGFEKSYNYQILSKDNSLVAGSKGKNITANDF